ncbi:conserved hypothetical protein [Streptomyces pristinaespiralis ATCC 25486]|uniref:YcaO domain-containing protein n=1 Tax=Streptomyces pristinaespiralis (strain ATCC 25486 / DSM 40338 / CBS 914.69 / JCM 4507 / KCC S-0507 / NBRC 13074 / NRRL 2958 / 5647) TaxID=457429 RepID=D6X9F0_STRE2|nr:conserved hypothetical protein [Streptomyces pristinaespiralis ATCC 25486]
MTADVGDARRFGAWPADRVSLGTTFGDPEGARIAAVAEAVERYCGNRLPPAGHPDAPRRATAAELLAEGRTLYGPGDLPVYADWQYERPRFEYGRLTLDTPALWARAQEDGEECWAPVALTHLNWRQGELRSLPRTHHLNYAGIATGQGFDDAVERGLLEVVERDALELWWHLDGPTRGIDPASVPGLTRDLDGCGLEVSVVEMPSEFAPCMAALVHDPARGIHAAGFACRYDPADAAPQGRPGGRAHLGVHPGRDRRGRLGLPGDRRRDAGPRPLPRPPGRPPLSRRLRPRLPCRPRPRRARPGVAGPPDGAAGRAVHPARPGRRTRQRGRARQPGRSGGAARRRRAPDRHPGPHHGGRRGDAAAGGPRPRVRARAQRTRRVRLLRLPPVRGGRTRTRLARTRTHRAR